MATWSAQIVGSTILREALITLSDVTDLVKLEADNTKFKILYEHVEDHIALPYIVITHIAGGFENTTPATVSADMDFKIVLHSFNMSQSVLGMKAIAGLHRMLPVTILYAQGNPDGNTPVAPYATIRQRLPIHERRVVQNVSYFMGGGIYRIRLIEE